MIATWRLIAAAVLAALSYLLSRPVMEALLIAIRRRLGKGFQWVGDMQRYMVRYLSWICFFLLLMCIAEYILQVGDNDALMNTLTYALAVPVVLGTFSLRKVVTNMIVRHFKWGQDETEYDTRIFVVTEGINFFVFVLIAVEIFYIFFVSNEMAEFLLVVVLASFEVLVICAGFTTLKNVATGLFLIFAEPFRTGSLCRIHDLLGFIEKVSLARTTLRRNDGSLVFIPNGVFADWHQTSGSAQEAQLHELVLQTQQTTPIEKIQQLIDELSVILPQFAMPDVPASRAVSFRGSESATMTPQTMTPQAMTPQAMTPQSIRYPNDANHSFASTDMRLNAAMTSEERNCRVVLHAMYCVKVSILVDRARFASLEAVKTEINMAIVESLQRIGIVTQQRIL